MLLIGAGLPRTGTMSLKIALEKLTGKPCHHMFEVVDERPSLWADALAGDLSKLDEALDGFACAVDFPASAFWRELAERYPQAPVLLSHRGDAASWWRSADATVWESMRQFFDDPPPDEPELYAMYHGLMTGFDPAWRDPAAARSAYERHLEDVRATIAGDRLFEYVPGDGWAPLCAALELPEPDMAFPDVNTTAQFRSHQGWEPVHTS